MSVLPLLTTSMASAPTLPDRPVEGSSSHVSSLYTFLPKSLTSRMPVLSSIRRSMRLVVTRQQPTGSCAPAETIVDVASTVERNDALHHLRDAQMATREHTWQIRGPDLGPRSSTRETLDLASASEDRYHRPYDLAQLPSVTSRLGGIDWNTATTGVLLWIRARLQARQSHANAAALRSQHIHSLTYMLRALPEDMTQVELDIIRDVLPPGVSGKTAGMQDRVPRYSNACPERSSASSGSNLLGRSIAFIIVQLALLFSFVLPLLTQFLSLCLRYERRHRLTERALIHGGKALEALGEKGLDLRDVFFRFSEGRVGEAVSKAGTWVANGVVHGVNDGAGKSLVVIVQSFTADGGRR